MGRRSFLLLAGASLALGGCVSTRQYTDVVGFFVGQTMKAMQGKGNPAVVNDLLRKALG